MIVYLNTLLRFIIAFLLLLSLSKSYGQDVFINEVMSSNQAFWQDEDGDDSDWIELYNATSNLKNLNGFYFSDDADDLTKWTFPNVEIPPYSFLMVVASGKNRSIANQELHTNFKIKSSGETLFLSDANGNLIHSVQVIPLSTNISYGLIQDGIAPFLEFQMPTPNASNNTASAFDVLSFSHLGGIYEQAFELSITNLDPNTTIYYTTDGTIPTLNAFKYENPLLLNETLYSTANLYNRQISPPDLHLPPASEDVPKAIVIRAMAMDTQGNPTSLVSTHTYFIQELGIHHNIPIVALSVEHSLLFDNGTGIFIPGVHWDENNPDWTGNYYQRGDEWERQAFIEYYANELSQGFRQNIGIRTHGGNSRRMPQKGIRLYARSDYGKSEFEYPIFEDKPLEIFKRLVLKPISSSWSNAGIEDFMANKLASTLNIDCVAIRPVMLYLNGEYWGIYYLQERIDEDFIITNYSIDEDSINTSWDNLGPYSTLSEFIKKNDLALASNYNIVAEQIDIDNFIDYQLYQIYIANYDWPSNNVKFWRPKMVNGKWRWIFFDGDAGFRRVEFDGYEQALSLDNDASGTDTISTRFLRKLLENDNFKTQFFHRLEYLLHHELSTNSILPFYEDILNEIGSEIPNQINRFGYPIDYGRWNGDINKFLDFIKFRPCEIYKLTKERFDIELNISEDCKFKNDIIQELSVYPNPNSGNFYMKFASSLPLVGQITIRNTLGQLIYSEHRILGSGENLIEFNDFKQEGIFFISVVTRYQQASSKIIIRKN